jgi:GAF domain-containing protein
VTGWAVERGEPVRVSQLHLDPRAAQVPGTPATEPEALVSVPLIARGRVKGALNVYRLGEEADFSDPEFELLTRFGDAVALALDNAEIRLRLEHEAQTDSLTGLYNYREFHEALRRELDRSAVTGQPVAVLMLDLDDFKRVNDTHGHACGDDTLIGSHDSCAACSGPATSSADSVARSSRRCYPASTPSVPTRSPSASSRRLRATGLGPVEADHGLGRRRLLPLHSTSARGTGHLRRGAMMAGKAHGKNQAVVFESDGMSRPDGDPVGRDARSLAHLKLLQSLVGRLNRLNSTEEIGEVIVEELATLIDYHDCRLYVMDGERLVPVAFRGDLGVDEAEAFAMLGCRVGEGVTGRAALTGRSLLVGDSLDCEYALQIPGTSVVQESMAATPLLYAGRVIGVIVLSKLGRDQFDEHDVHLLEVLAGHAAVSLERGLFEAAREEAERLERTLLTTVEAIASALEARGGMRRPPPRPRLTGRHGRQPARNRRSAPSPAPARRASPRRGHDRLPGGDPRKAWAADPRGAVDPRAASRARRADPLDRVRARRGTPDRPALPRALRRHRVPGRPRRRADPARVADHPRLRRPPRDERASALSRPARAGARPRGAAARRGPRIDPDVVAVLLDALEYAADAA